MKKLVYRNLGDGEATPLPQEIINYFNKKYAGQMVPLNAEKANEIAEILGEQGVDVKK